MMDSSPTIDQITPLLLGNFLPTLQETAALKVALSLWYGVLFGEENKASESKKVQCLTNAKEAELGPWLDKSFRVRVNQLLEKSSIPELNKTQIRESCEKVNKSLDAWVFHHNRQIRCIDKLIIYYSHLEYCVWKWNGEIDYKKTARNLLHESSFSEMQKFEIMCHYCLEDELKILSNTDLSTFLKYFTKSDTFLSKPLAYYWICKLTEEQIHEIPHLAAESVECFMLRRAKYNPWAVEHFWDRMSEQNQITMAIELLPFYGNRWQKKLLGKMNEFQLNLVLSTIPSHVIMNFLRSRDFSLAFSIWMCTKLIITDEQFATLVEDVRAVSGWIYCENFDNWLVQLWNTADDHHKEYFLRAKRSYILSCYFSPENGDRPSSSYEFLFSILSYASVEYRRDLILKRGHELIINENFQIICKIIELCLPNPVDIMKFKEQNFKSSVVRRYCKSLTHSGGFKSLNKYLKNYLPEDQTVIDFFMGIFSSGNLKCDDFIFESATWLEFNKLIDYIHPCISTAISIKKRFIFECELNCLNEQKIERLNQLENIIAKFLSDDEMMKFKSKLLNQCRDMLMDAEYWTCFDQTYFEQLLIWILGSQKEMMQFKRTLSSSKTFPMLDGWKIHTLIVNFDLNKLNKIDEFLNWFLVEPKKVEGCKLYNVFASDNVEFIEDTFDETREENTRLVLVWFLNNDRKSIGKFRSKFKGYKISKII